MLANWVTDPSAGKIIVFTHHLNVLDALKKLLRTSHKKQNYVRIDRKIAPNTHQKHINAFKEGLSLQVAVLSLSTSKVGGDAQHMLHHVVCGAVLVPCCGAAGRGSLPLHATQEGTELRHRLNWKRGKAPTKRE